MQGIFALVLDFGVNRLDALFLFGTLGHAQLAFQLAIKPAFNALPKHDPGETYDWVGTTIYANASPAYLDYTYDLQDAGRFPADFEIALSWYLSILIAVPLTRDTQIRDNAFKMAMVMAARASANDWEIRL